MEDTTRPGVASKPVAPPDEASHSGPLPQQERTRASGEFSPKLVQMLLDLTPEQRAEAAAIVGKLLAAKAYRRRKKD